MKLTTVAAAAFLLAAPAQASKKWVWCAKKGKCSSGKGVGPTYKCGQNLYDYYSIQTKRWSMEGVDHWDQFKDCCYDAGKTACYQRYGL